VNGERGAHRQGDPRETQPEAKQAHRGGAR
jgi:hypothetical protein